MRWLVLAFLRRDARIHGSYRIGFFLDTLATLASASIFFFVSKLIPSDTASLQPYGGNYFGFVLIGLAFSQYQGQALNAFSGAMQVERERGTLEAVLVTPVSTLTFLIGSTLWDFCQATAHILVYVLTGIFIFGLRLSWHGLGWGLVTFALAYAVFFGLGLLAAAFLLRYRRGSPITWAISEVSDLLGGVYFPLAVLPGALIALTPWIPMTHALEAFRLALLQGAGPQQLVPHWLALAGFAAVFMGLGAWAFQGALRHARRTGSLSQI